MAGDQGWSKNHNSLLSAAGTVPASLPALLLFWLDPPELNKQRVAERVRKGSHHIPEDVIRRRYIAGLKNFFLLYKPLADFWQSYDNTDLDNVLLIAHGKIGQPDAVLLPEAWLYMKEIADNE